ncbi:MAG TPA: UDP-N-acetylmuramate dehydrogenase [Chloroflexia bacterium]|nr:UDP-N-acetylmuramate dehydrogenase [Chloroflexia bacterium]
MPNSKLKTQNSKLVEVGQGELLSKHTSLRIGGPADYFLTTKSADQLVAAVRAAREIGLPYLVIGNGTNLLVLDGGVRGLVIHNRAHQVTRVVIDRQGAPLPAEREAEGVEALWRADGGLLWTQLARMSVAEGWIGAEWGNSIPGSVGAGVVSNAGAHGGDMAANLRRVWVLDAAGIVAEWPVERLQLGYRTSVFKAPGTYARRALSAPVVLRVELLLCRGTVAEGTRRMREYLAHRQLTQPQGKSAGSTFKNPPGDSAGRLIEAVGLKGYRYGNAQFSPVHANFLMNLGGATSAEVLHLLELARTRVLEQTGIALETEIEIVGEA